MNSAPSLLATDFRGTPQEAAEFVSRCWDMQFPQNVTCPQWDAEHFAWQLFSQPDNVLLGAYDGDELVGFLFSEPLDFLWQGRPLRGLFSSLLSADPGRKGQGIGKALAAELSRRIKAGNMAFDVGFAVPGSGSLGPKFWLGAQKGLRAPGVRPWIRPLDSAALAKSAGASTERWAARAGAVLGADRISPREVKHLRPYAPADLERCLDLVRLAETDSDFRYDWSAARLAFQLHHHGIPSTWVYDDGTVRGFANFHRIWFRGRDRFAAGQIDHLIAENGNRRIERSLMTKTLQLLKQTGHDLAICPSSASTSKRTKLRKGFIPMPARYDLLFAFLAADLQVSEIRRPKVHLR